MPTSCGPLSPSLWICCFPGPSEVGIHTGVTSEKQASAKPVPAWGCLPSWWLLPTLLARSMESIPTWWAERPAGGASAQGWPHLPAGPSSPTQHPGVMADAYREDCSQAVAAPATKPPYGTDPSPSGPQPCLHKPQCQGPLQTSRLASLISPTPPHPPCLGFLSGFWPGTLFPLPFQAQSLTGIYCAPAVCKRVVL